MEERKKRKLPQNFEKLGSGKERIKRGYAVCIKNMEKVGCFSAIANERN